MANALIPSNLTFTKKSVEDLFVKPMIQNPDIYDYATVHQGVNDSKQFVLTNNMGYVTKRHARGSAFTPEGSLTFSPKDVQVYACKAEIEHWGEVFWSTILAEYLKTGVNTNNIEGTPLADILISVFKAQLVQDRTRQTFFGDRNSEEFSSGIKTGVANKHYNPYDGFWTNYIKDIYSGVISSANQKLDVGVSAYVNTVPVAQVATVTLTGTSGTANISVMGVNYLATFATSLTVTAANFKSLHEAALLARGVVVTSSAATIIFTAQHKGNAISVNAPVNASGDLAGSVAATTANVATGTLKTDAAYNIFTEMVALLYKNRPYAQEIMGDKTKAPILVTNSLYQNYKKTLQANMGTSSLSYEMVLNGRPVLTFDGHPVINRFDWDVAIADLGNVYPHRALMQMPSNSLILTNIAADTNLFEYYYDVKTQQALSRCEYKMNTAYIYPEFVIAAY
jgi:hypothetical protein